MSYQCAKVTFLTSDMRGQESHLPRRQRHGVKRQDGANGSWRELETSFLDKTQPRQVSGGSDVALELRRAQCCR